MKILISLLSMVSLTTFAAGDGHGGGHVADLMWPFINVSLLVGFLVYKLKTPLSEHFSKKSTDVENQMNSAKIKAEEAEVLISRAESKMKNLEAEIVKIKEETKKEIAKFEEDYAIETKQKIEKIIRDGETKVEAEKIAGFNGLSEELVNSVVVHAKSLLKNDPAKAKQVTEKLLQDLGR